MKTTISFRIALAVLAAISTSTLAFVPSGQFGKTCTERSFGGVCTSKWGTTALRETAARSGDTQKRSYQRNNNNNNNRRNNRTGGGRGGQPALKLENPMRVQRIAADPPPPRRERQQSNNDRGPSSGGSGPVATASTDSSDGAYVKPKPKKVFGNDAAPASPNTQGKRKRGRRSGGDDNDSRNRGRTSLRIGTGRKGRAAALSSRRGSLRKRDRTAEKEARAAAAEERRTVSLPDGPLTVAELADLIDEKPVSVIKLLMTDLGVMASMTQSLDPATCAAVVEGFGKIVGGADDEDDEFDDDLEESALSVGFVTDEDDPDSLQPRAPVVTIMGHVDHGKTSLLDAIRNTDVTAGEAGGITQHIAAYQVKHNGKKITFIDTPGHAAFTDMRERGANITDIVILVVAADDSVKQQTADSIVCARQAGVPLVVAINKCDLETADPMRVMSDLTGYDILTEEFGGEVLSSQISAKQGTGLDDLLDKIMLQAEVEDLKANPDRNAEAIVIEANLEKGLGTVATSLVKKGTLRVGDIFVAGETYGKVRALIDTNDGKTRIKEAGPSQPVNIVGFEGIPSAGDALVVMDDEQAARALAESRQRIARERSSSSYQDGLMDAVSLAFGSTKERREMCVLVKADVQGSAEALTRALSELKLENEEAVVTVKVLVSEAGEVTKSDVAIASVTPDTTIIAFNCAASFAAMEDARAQNIPIEYYSIVYDAIESVESRMQEVLSPTPDGEYTGSAIVQEVFNIGGTGNIAGSRCNDGILKKGGNVRVMRGDKILIETKIKSLRNFKAEADTIEAGNECGIGLIDFEDFQPDDVIECYVE
mmetsp:Transcript_15157/g.43792  ORF Transcript_15157/g.43792 Transcript_15157/m.43792 type:complete len:824 (+) Transcript_15157:134-2605(+)|eukprot:CAMPEP_0176024656 /NCGR_PEP_ID=MMETSP0120_2-20121206/12051_1 /TAXON_ID=160619 /ORGANISM="Kryptoperidinium foliaceum, Strain CCMP 1326" /LENGTH=823 /DNA_ID=CAMNT_0017357835 /DNA_START=128 /DNA_END=2599 /DNA_ORIENTATION=+